MSSDTPPDSSSVRNRTSTAADGAAARIRYCVWEITLACDLGCKHCGSRAGKAREAELTTDECLEVVEQLAAIGCREVALIGGEAYLREDWDVIARAIVDAGMRCGITTGARNLTPERVARARAAGIDAVSVSIDGLEATHDDIRGARGSWRAALEGARLLREAGVPFGFNTQINRLSMPELPAIAQLLVYSGGVAWQLQLTVPMGRAADRPELLLQPSDLLELYPLLVWIKEARLDPAGVQLQPGNNIGYFGGYEELLRIGGNRGARWSPCAAGRNVLGLEADGAIKGCPSLPTASYTGGNVRTHRLADIIDTADELTHLRNRTVDDLWGFCRTCEHAAKCLAGCTWTSHVFFGRPGNNPYCIHRALVHESLGKRETLVLATSASGKPFDHGTFRSVVEDVESADVTATVTGVPILDVLSASPATSRVHGAEHAHRLLRRARHVAAP